MGANVDSKDAVISDCGRYRYRLWRQWTNTERMPVLWIMLNPSTADASQDDPTIRRCIAFSKQWGYGALWVGNLYAYRSTDPAVLGKLAATEARGPENIAHLSAMAEESAIIICAWGTPGGKVIPSVCAPGGLWCLGRTKHGSPRHPLYVRSDQPLMEYAP